jgi:hypothetical protein
MVRYSGERFIHDVSFIDISSIVMYRRSSATARTLATIKIKEHRTLSISAQRQRQQTAPAHGTGKQS